MLDKDKVEKIIIIVLIGIFAVIGWLQTRPGPTPVVESIGDIDQGNLNISSDEEATQITDTDKSSEEVLDTKVIFIHIDGQVNSPGLYQLDEGARVQDALDLAGGITEEGSLDYINLSAKLQDEMKIRIPSKDEVALEKDRFCTLDIIQGSEVGQSQSSEEGPPGLININTASIEELISLPGIGEAKAKAIIAYREESLFRTIEEIMEVTGIGEKIYEQIKDLIIVE